MNIKKINLFQVWNTEGQAYRQIVQKAKIRTWKMI